MDSDNPRPITGSRKNISASEIAEYQFCSVAWFLDRNGVPRESGSNRRLMTGYMNHQQIGRKIESSNRLITGMTVLLLLLIAFLVAVLI